MIQGEIVGDIRITVCKTKDGYDFFHLQADNDKVLSVLETIQNTLSNH